MQQETQEVFHHILPVQIRFNDIDGFGHVNNATFQEYFDLGRVDYFKKAFGGRLFTKELAMLIASIKTDFLTPVHLHDQVEVRTKVFELGNKSLKMLQHVVDIKNNQVKAVCLSVMVCFRTDDNGAEVIPQAWRDKFKEMETL
ncbi:MAG: thioesterase family protein [Breznakibacter sp.]